MSGPLDGVSEEVDHQLVDVKAEKRRQLQSLERMRGSSSSGGCIEMGYETPEIEDMAPMLVDLKFDLAPLLAQEGL